jgi:hypothetical protein
MRESGMADQDRQAVIVRLKLSDDEFGEWSEREGCYAVEDRLFETFVADDLGEVDGHEFGGGFATFLIYGPSADRIAAAVLPIVKSVGPRAGSVMTKRFGPQGSREETLDISEGAA